MDQMIEKTPERNNPLIDRDGIHHDAIVAVGKCMLARAMVADFNIQGYEVKAIQTLVTAAPEPVTVRDIADTFREAGVAGSPRTTERTMAILRGRGILSTAREWRTAYYTLDKEVVELHMNGNVERLQRAREMREKLDSGDMSYFLQLVAQSVPSESSREQHEHTLNVLRQNAGWPVALKDIGLKKNHITNPSRLVRELSDVLPDGIIQKNGTNNQTTVQFNYEALIAFVVPDNGEPPAYERLLTEETMSNYDGLRVQLDIRTKRALEIIALLEHHGGTLPRSNIRTLLGMEGVVVTKEKMHVAFTALRKHALITERQIEGSQDIEISLVPEFDRTIYGVNQSSKLNKREQKKIDIQVAAHERASMQAAKEAEKMARVAERQRAADERAQQRAQEATERQLARDARITERATVKAEIAAAKAARAQESATARLLEKKQAPRRLRNSPPLVKVDDLPIELPPPIANFVPKKDTASATPDEAVLKPDSESKPHTGKFGPTRARMNDSERQLREGLHFDVMHPAALAINNVYDITKTLSSVPLAELASDEHSVAELKKMLTKVRTANGTSIFAVSNGSVSLRPLFQSGRRKLIFTQVDTD